MSKKKTLILSFLLFLLFSFTGLSFSQTGGTLERIEVTPVGETLEVKLFVTPYTFHRQFRLYNPMRIGIDLFNVGSIRSVSSIDVGALGIDNIRVTQMEPNFVRIIFQVIDEFPPYVTERFAGGLKITFHATKEPPMVKEKVEVEVPEAAEAICDIRVEPTRANPNDPILVDMSGSQNAESMVVEVFDPEGAKVASKELTPEASRWEVVFEKPGEYVFKGKAFNIEGKVSENPCETAASINFPPTSKLECRKCEGVIGKTFILDASGSTDPDGEIVQVDFEITDEEGIFVDRFSDVEKPFTWERAFQAKGTYLVTAVATDDLGTLSEPSNVEVRVKQKKFYLLVDLGALAGRGEGTYVGYAAGRAGILYKISKSLEIILTGGGAYTPIDSDPWEQNFFTGSVILNMRAGPIYIGVGGAYTTPYKDTIRNDYGEIITNIGFDLLGGSKITGSIFLEASGPPIDLSIQNNHKFMLGFRVLF
jgi:hypothetical protein